MFLTTNTITIIVETTSKEKKDKKKKNCINCILTIQFGQITPSLGMKILLQFDKSINTSLATRVKTKITFKVNSHYIITYIYL